MRIIVIVIGLVAAMGGFIYGFDSGGCSSITRLISF